MRRSWMICCTVVLLTVFHVAIAAAQPGRGRRGRPTIDRAMALGIQQVLDELKITDDQAATIQAAVEAYQEERREARPGRADFQFLSPEEQDELREQFRKESEEASKKADETLAALLEPEQVKRLDQLVLQGQLMFSPIETLRKTVDLTEEQVAEMQRVQEDAEKKQSEMRNEMRQRFQGGGGRNIDFNEVRQMFQKLQSETITAAMAVLTDDQKAALEELQGEKMEFDLQSLMRGGPRGRGGPGRGGRGGRPGGRRQRPAADDDV